MFMVFPSPVRVQRRDPTLRRIKVEREEFRKLGDGKRSNCYREALKYAIRVSLIGPLDFHHHPLVRFVQRLRKFIESAPDTLRNALP